MNQGTRCVGPSTSGVFKRHISYLWPDLKIVQEVESVDLECTGPEESYRRLRFQVCIMSIADVAHTRFIDILSR